MRRLRFIPISWMEVHSTVVLLLGAPGNVHYVQNLNIVETSCAFPGVFEPFPAVFVLDISTVLWYTLYHNDKQTNVQTPIGG
jgi:hypothetical protein